MAAMRRFESRLCLLVAVLLVAACEGRRAPGATAPAERSVDAAPTARDLTPVPASNEPRVSTTILGRTNTEKVRERDRQFRANPENRLRKTPPLPWRMAAVAAPGRAEVTWYVAHNCGLDVTPEVEVGERSIHFAVASAGRERADCAIDDITMFKTIITGLPAGRYRLSGPPAMDMMLDVPERGSR